MPHAHPLILLAASALVMGAAFAPAQAATLSVTIGDTSGKPLSDGVLLLDPVAAKVAVKPMADVEISQSKRTFHPRVTLITTGTKATFPNFDTVRHHVYSFSPIKTFELKLYAGVPNAPLTFDKPGFAVLGCNIHDTMAAWVVVADTPWHARSGISSRTGLRPDPNTPQPCPHTSSFGCRPSLLRAFASLLSMMIRAFGVRSRTR